MQNNQNHKLEISLHRAIGNHDTMAVAQILALNPDIFFENLDGQIPINYAISIRNMEAARLLLPLYADHKDMLSMVDAASSGDLEAVRFLLQEDVDINRTDQRGRTPLMEAASYPCSEMIQFLIEHGANVHQKACDNETTALLIAEHEGNTEIISILKQAGATE